MSLLLSANSSRKAHLHRKMQQYYKKQIAALELILRKDRKEDHGVLFALLDKFYPKEHQIF